MWYQTKLSLDNINFRIMFHIPNVCELDKLNLIRGYGTLSFHFTYI